MDWVGLDWVGLGWVGLTTVGLTTVASAEQCEFLARATVTY